MGGVPGAQQVEGAPAGLMGAGAGTPIEAAPVAPPAGMEVQGSANSSRSIADMILSKVNG